MAESGLLQKRANADSFFGYLFAASSFLLITALFALLPMPGGDDWKFFRGVIHQLLSGESIYRTSQDILPFHYPPWVAALLVPLGILPANWGWALLSTLSIFLAVSISRRYQMGILKQVLVLLSPPMLYTLLHGQIDILALAVVLLPQPFWLIGSITKPQVTIGLLFGIPRKDYLKAAVVAAGVVLISFLFFGLWPIELLQQPKEFASMRWNMWGGIWPYQLPLGLALIFRGWSQKDERYLIASSPFFLPYAAISSFIGPWIALASMLEDRQAAVVLIAWWAASFSRLIW